MEIILDWFRALLDRQWLPDKNGGGHVDQVGNRRFVVHARTSAGRRWLLQMTTRLEYERCGCGWLKHVERVCHTCEE